MKLTDVENHLEAQLARQPVGSGPVTGERVRAVLTELSELQIDASPLRVAEDVLAIEVNPLDEEAGKPTPFGVLFVRRLFLRPSDDDETAAVEIGIEFELPAEAGLEYAEPKETQVELTPATGPALTTVLERFDATPAGKTLLGRDVTPEVFLQDHDEILD